MKIGICKLCLHKKNLCGESHIIPDFHYKFLYGKNKELKYLHSGEVETRYNSEYENNILCEECERKIIGRLDDYASKLIHNKFSSKTIFRRVQIDGRDCLVLKNSLNYNYSCFKLFLLSLLWRASISTRPFFKAIKLNTQIEEDLRLMILNNNPGDPQKYPCFINLPPLMPTPGGGCGFITLHMQTMSPKHVKDGQFEAYEFVIEGIHYFFVISVPQNWTIAPSIERNKLTICFASIRDQEEILKEVVKILKKKSTPMGI